MPCYLLSHHHGAQECPAAFAAWKGFDSPLRSRPVLASCAEGGHCIWWTVEAAGAVEALALLPAYVAERTEVTEVSDVTIP